jgi:hypothetical protein
MRFSLYGDCDGRDFILGAARFGIHNRAGRGDLAQGEKMNQTLERIRQSKSEQFWGFVGAFNFHAAIFNFAVGNERGFILSVIAVLVWILGLWRRGVKARKVEPQPEFDFDKKPPRLPLIPFDGQQEVRTAYIPSERVRGIIARWKSY